MVYLEEEHNEKTKKKEGIELYMGLDGYTL